MLLNGDFDLQLINVVGGKAKTASEIEKEVKKQYHLFPFPKADYVLANWFSDLLAYFESVAPLGKQSYLEDVEILDAGCGTGATAIALAQKYPKAHVTGVDFNETSLRIASDKKEQKNLSNLNFQEDNILSLNLGKKFDVIISIGVIHHLTNMELGLSNLVKHLKPNGYIVLWLYGEYGRYYLNLNQKFLKNLFSGVDDISMEAKLTKVILSEFPKELLQCHIDVPDSSMAKDFDRALDFAIDNEAWMVDQFLHPNERVFTIDDVQKLLSDTHLTMKEWLGVNTCIKSLTSNTKIQEMFFKLPIDQQLRCIDYLYKPFYYQVATQVN